MPPGMQRVEIGNALYPEHHRFAINDEAPLPVLQRGLDNPRIAVGPVITAASDQAHAVTVALQAEPIAVVCNQAGTDLPRVGRQNSNFMARR